MTKWNAYENNSSILLLTPKN